MSPPEATPIGRERATLPRVWSFGENLLSSIHSLPSLTVKITSSLQSHCVIEQIGHLVLICKFLKACAFRIVVYSVQILVIFSVVLCCVRRETRFGPAQRFKRLVLNYQAGFHLRGYFLAGKMFMIRRDPLGVHFGRFRRQAGSYRF